MKAILVLDKPESCTGCLLGIFNKKWFCLATNKDIDICDRYNIPSWCPLRPIPDKAAETLINGLDAIKNMESIEVRKVIRTE